MASSASQNTKDIGIGQAVSLETFGTTTVGQLGVNPEVEPTGRGRVYTHSHQAVDVACGPFHTLVVRRDGSVLSAGREAEGQLGRNTGSGSRAWTFAPIGALEAHNIVAAACAQDASYCLSAAGHVFSWGSSQDGQLGNGQNPREQEYQRIPRPVKALHSVVVTAVAAGQHHVVALSSDSAVYTWGANSDGQLGDGQFTSRSTPWLNPAFNGKGVHAIAAGARHSVALTLTSGTYAFGANEHGQLGVGDTRPRLRPTPVHGVQRKAPAKVACGDFHTCILTARGHLYTFGSNSDGQLGIGSISDDEKIVSAPRLNVFLQEHGRVWDVAAGRRHTVALVENAKGSLPGTVFTFGCNTDGQLGLDNGHPAFSQQRRSIPTECSRFVGRTLRAFAGGNATIVMVSANDADPAQGSRPPAQAPVSSHSPLVQRRSFSSASKPAAEPTSSATPISMDTSSDDASSHQQPDVASTAPSRSDLIPISLAIQSLDPNIISSLLTEISGNSGEADSKQRSSLLKLIGAGFSSLGCINASFASIQQVCDQEQYAAPPFVDLEAADFAYRSIMETQDSNIISALTTAISRASRQLRDASLEPPDMGSIFVLLLCPVLRNQDRATSALESLCRGLLSYGDAFVHAGIAVFGRHKKELFARAVQTFTSFLTHLLKSPGSPDDLMVHCSLVLSMLANVNAKCHLVPLSTFYVPDIGASEHRLQAIFEWLMAPSQSFSFATFPFLLDLDTKAKFLKFCSQHVMARRIFANLAFNRAPPLLVFNVRREHILDDTLKQLKQAKTETLACPLRVQFADEEGVDEGGLVKEFYQLIIPIIYRRFLRPLEADGSGHWMWFSDPTEENLEAYYALGQLYGLALHNGVLIDQLFPLVLYKMLLMLESPTERTFDMSDLESASPQLASGLKQLLQHEGCDEEDVFCLDFTLSYRDASSNPATIELVPNGKETPVTFRNKEEYVRLYIFNFFYGRCAASIDAFKMGFHKVVAHAYATKLLVPEELERILCGDPSWDLRDLEKNTQYHGYGADSAVVSWFWETVHSFPGELKKKFLKFSTGTTRVPVSGMRRMPFHIQRVADERLLPAAHTCFNIVDLPEYKTKEELAAKLTTAIQETEGFTLV